MLLFKSHLVPFLLSHVFFLQIPSFQGMPVRNLIQFLVPHRLVMVEESAIAAKAFVTMVRERVTGAAVINEGQQCTSCRSLRIRELRIRAETGENQSSFSFTGRLSLSS
jgi:hypothetical protein